MIDTLRGMTMLLVVFSHALEPLFLNRPDLHFDWAAFELWRAIYSFHMPAFYFVSGATASNIQNETSGKAFSRSLALVLFAELAHLLVAPLIIARWPAGQTAWHKVTFLLTPLFLGYNYDILVIWFLFSLAVITLLAWLHERFGLIARVSVWILAIAGLALTQSTGTVPFQCQSWAPGLFFFLLGRARRRSRYFPLRFGRLRALAAAAVSALCVGLTYSANNAHYGLLSLHAPQTQVIPQFAVWMNRGDEGFLPLFVFTALSGIAFLAFVSMALRETLPDNLLALVGRKTLSLLVLNGFVLVWVQPRLFGRLPHYGMRYTLPFSLTITTAQLCLLPVVDPVLSPVYRWCGSAVDLLLRRGRQQGSATPSI